MSGVPSPIDVEMDSSNSNHGNHFEFNAPDVDVADVETNINPENWTFRGTWESAPQEWQEFMLTWRSANADKLVLKFDDPILELDPIFRSMPVRNRAIYVRDCYVETADAIWKKAFLDLQETDAHGVLLTGQPGTGKSCFLFYLLIRLLQKKQNVAFTPNGISTYLFFDNRAYVTQEPDPQYLPRSNEKAFLWCLADIKAAVEPPTAFRSPGRFLVQAASPSPLRYATWVKEVTPLVLGLPTWSKTELKLAYDSCFSDLEAIGLNVFARLKHQFWFERGLELPLNDLLSGNNWRQNIKVFRKAHLHDILLECFPDGTPTTSEAISCLVDAAILRFGKAARDVYEGLCSGTKFKTKHLDYNHLRAAINAEESYQTTPEICVSHAIIAVNPFAHPDTNELVWHIGFKSDWIKREMMSQLLEVEESRLRDDFRLFRTLPQASSLAGWILEALAHRLLTQHGQSHTDEFWHFSRMKSSKPNSDSPRYTTTSSTPHSQTFAKVTRPCHSFTSSSLPKKYQHQTYYLPRQPNFPLFDSFSVDLDLDSSPKSAVVWAFQMTMMEKHGGSAKGYKAIATICNTLCNQLSYPHAICGDECQPDINIRWVLVTDKVDTAKDWQFPKGFSKHEGPVFWLHLKELNYDN